MDIKITDKRRIILFFLLCFLAYFSTYLGRLNYSASLVQMIAEEGFEKGTAGIIGTGFFIAYGIGQLVSGFLGEYLNGKRMVFAGLFISAVLNALMAFSHSIGTMSVIWCMNGMAQALIWSPLLKMICDMVDDHVAAKICLYINFSVPLGTFFSYLLSAVCLKWFGWRMAFLMPAVLILFSAFLWLYGITKKTPYDQAYLKCHRSVRQIYKRKGKVKSPEFKQQIASEICWIGKSGVFILMIALFVQGALKDGVTTWVPTYLQEVYKTETAFAVIGTTLLPLCNLMGVSLASVVNKITGYHEIGAASFFFGICIMSLSVLYFWNDCRVTASLILLAIATTSMTGVNTMLIGVLPSRFGAVGRASVISGILNSVVYLGCAVSTYGIGALSEYFGWNFTFLIWLIAAVIAMGICLGLIKKWSVFLENLGKQKGK